MEIAHGTPSRILCLKYAMYYIIKFFLTFLKADVRMGLMQASRKEGREKIETGSGDSAKGPEIT